MALSWRSRAGHPAARQAHALGLSPLWIWALALVLPLTAPGQLVAQGILTDRVAIPQEAPRDESALRISLDEVRRAAASAMVAGRPEDALLLAEAVLLGAPEDVPALFIRARALRDLDRESEAMQASRDAWQAARRPRDRFYAAMMMAQTRSFAGNNGLAQLWLRRAAQLAPEEDLRELAVRDFRDVRRMTPWRLALDFYAQPSDNLNDASEDVAVSPSGWTPQVAPPLAGERYGGSVQLRYTLPLAARRRLHLGGFVGGSFVRIAPSDRDTPGADAADYSQFFLGSTTTYETLSADGAQINRSGLTLLRHWQGGVPLADIARLDLSVHRAVTPKLRFGVNLGLEDVSRKDSSTGDSQRRALGLEITQRFEHGALTLDLGVGETKSAAYNVGRTDGEVRLSYALAEPVRGMLPSVALEYGAFNYDEPWIADPTGPDRRDSQWALGLDVVLPDLDYYGFAPQIGLSFTDRKSNYTLYESRSTDLRLGLKSVF